MIKQSTIEEVRSVMDTQEVLQDLHVVFKNNTACCPFHNEKSASFRVWKKNNTYKCFGCGASGDGITAVMKLERKTFTEAVEWLAAKYHVMIEYDQAAEQESEEKKNARTEMLHLLDFAHRRYEDALHNMPNDAPVWQYLENRGYTADLCKEWNLGFAPNDWKFLTGSIINMGKHGPACEVGLLTSREGKTWDFYRNRIMIPIYNSSGILVGFGGRWLPTGDVKEDKEASKYFNPCESLVYNKQNTWYGLDRAMKAIKDRGFAYVQEGYFDVQAWHNGGVCNAIAACGTAISPIMIKILKRFTSHVVLCLDGDDAGKQKTMSAINEFLKQDYKVEVLPLPEKIDPDEYAKQFFIDNPALELAEETSIVSGA